MLKKKLITMLMVATTVSQLSCPAVFAAEEIETEEVIMTEVEEEDVVGVSNNKSDDKSVSENDKNDNISDPNGSVSNDGAEKGDQNAKDLAIEAAKAGKGRVGDTIILGKEHKGKKTYYTVSAASISDNAVVSIAKGSQFTIIGGDKKSFKTDAGAKKLVSVSSKGIVKAKKATNSPIAVEFTAGGAKKSIKVNVIDTEISVSLNGVSGNAASVPSVKKLAVTAYEGQQIDIKVKSVLSLTADKVKNNGVVSNTDLTIGDDGEYHIITKATKKGGASVSLIANGKRVTLKSKVKKVKA